MADATDQAIGLIDAANAADPNEALVRGERGPKEVLHARLLTAWVERLVDEPSGALRIAARAHHVRRWEHPRSEYPPGRRDYLRWRTMLYRFHAEATRDLALQAGVEQDMAERAAALVARRIPRTDPEAQALEDGLCLVFLETQLADVAARLDEAKMADVLRKTWRKMSPAGQSAAAALPISADARALLDRALGVAAEGG